ncbi:hypothetical protein [Lactiplantibacillus plantarum]|uniref:hypothetical protein n=1 Tax=Lactiplantibacillus plantarum TaxID=1590 RepID=UPI001592A89E|nr:hypothetical protein [Lactiplantibacillus plantarum]QKX09103.1 hypothetical protein Heal19_500497 [Lactiplantibacillus plantarum]
MALNYSFSDGLGEEVSIVVNPSNALLTVHDTASGDTVVTNFSIDELRQLSEFIRKTTDYVTND